MNKQWTDEELEELEKLYQEKNVKELCKIYGVSEYSLKGVLNYHKIKKKHRKKANSIKKERPKEPKTINENVNTKKRKIDLITTIGFNEYTYK